MAKYIRNMDELQKALMPTMANMVDTLAERVYETLNHFLQEYYNSYDPKSYRRQYDYLRSAVKIEPQIKGNKVTASVYIDTESMDDYYNATGIRWHPGGTRGYMEDWMQEVIHPMCGMILWIILQIMGNF